MGRRREGRPFRMGLTDQVGGYTLSNTVIPSLNIANSILLTLIFGAANTASPQQTLPSSPSPVNATDADATTIDAATEQLGEQAQLEELRRQVEILAEEVEQLRSGEPESIEVSDERRRALGLAPSAAAAYRRSAEGVSLAGYGEMLLENYADQNESGSGDPPTTQLDFLRATLYVGYRFNKKFLFNSEIEIEHGGETSVEFAYVDYLVNESLSFRGGLLLIPLGLVNELHEPTVFLGSGRPETEQRILPSTWRENGVGVLGSVGRVNFRGYLVNGLSASGFTAAGVRGGRQKGMKALAANMAFAGRLDVTPIPGLVAGVGLYRGGSGQDAVVLDGERLEVGTTIGEVHGQVQIRGFDVRALYARLALNDAAALTTALERTAPVAERMAGGYIQAGYNLLSRLATEAAMTPYVRYERVDTQRQVPPGFARDLSRDGTFSTLGVAVKPIPHIVVKTDYQWVSNVADTGRDQFNISLGYAF